MKRFSPTEFRALIRWKGWTHKDLAIHWDVSRVHVSRIVNDEERALHWNDAVIGLPRRARLVSDLAARQTRVQRLVADMPDALAAKRGRLGRPPRGAEPMASRHSLEDALLELEIPGAGSGYRHRGYVVTGSILTLDNDLGDSLNQGDRGIVFATVNTGVGERYGVIFENGDFDWFLPTDLDSGLSASGLDAEGASNYVYVSDSALRSDFQRGFFRFW
jgi:hypothetical protein